MNRAMNLSIFYRNALKQGNGIRIFQYRAYNASNIYLGKSSESVQDDSNSTTSSSSTKIINPVEVSKEWIPPNRPLSGDKGKSDVYAKKSTSTKSTTTNSLHYRPTKNEEYLDGDEEEIKMIDLDDIDLEALKKELDDLDDEDINSYSQLPTKSNHLNIEEYLDSNQWEDVNEGDLDHNESDFDYEEAIRNDEVIKELLKEEEFNTQDSELLDLQMTMIEERLDHLKEEYMKSNSIQKERSEEESLHASTYEAKGLRNKNYASNLSRDFINEEYSELDEFIKQQNKGSSTKHNDDDENPAAPDWLKTRRTKLFPSDMMTPEESQNARSIDGEIPIIKGVLLTSDEIILCLNNLGALDTILIIPDEETLPYLGWDGVIVATGSSYSHIRVLTDAIVRNLRKRDLAQKGIVGALYGSEGGEDTSSMRRRRGLPKRMDDGWIAVDCGNYIVHVQDEITRDSIDLEGLWSPGERGKAGRELRKVNPNDEETVDEYVANNPVPDGYSKSLVDLSGDFWGDGQMRGGFGQIGNNPGKKSGRWTPVSNEKRKFKNRRR